MNWQSLYKDAHFWKKLNRYLLISFSLLLLIYIGNTISYSFSLEPVSAEECQFGNCPQPEQPPSCPAQECSDDVTYCDNGRNIHKHGGYFDQNSCQCVYDFTDVGSCEVASPPTEQCPVQSCSDFAEYCDGNRLIRKHGGVFDQISCQCVYAFDEVGQCGETPPAQLPQNPQQEEQDQEQKQQQQQQQQQQQLAQAQPAQAQEEEDESESQLSVNQSQTATGGSVGDISNSVSTGSVTVNSTQTTGSVSQTTGSVSQTQNANPNITVNVPSTTTRVVTAQLPSQPKQVIKVAGVSSQQVTELPKTGLSVLAWGLASFIPLGFGSKLKRFEKSPKGLSGGSENAEEIFQKRILKTFKKPINI